VSVVGKRDDDLTLARLGQNCVDPVSPPPIFSKMGRVGDRMKIYLVVTLDEVKHLAYLMTQGDGPWPVVNVLSMAEAPVLRLGI
jgi:hypothetical protein